MPVKQEEDSGEDIVFALDDDEDTDAGIGAEAEPASTIGAAADDTACWRVLLVDDEPAIHDVTKIALRNLTFEGRRLQFLDAYSAKEACDILRYQPAIALIFLDVVMESDNAGFEVIKYVRDTLQNKIVSIVLRTGQPGMAPERDVVVSYAINDYKAKSELTAQKLAVTVIASLRAYCNLVQLDHLSRNLALEVARQTEGLRAKTQELEQLNSHLEERVQQEAEQVRRKEQLLIQQSKLAEMGEMIGSIAHQWRQPLNMLSLMVQDLPEAYRYHELSQASLDKTAEDCMVQIQHMSDTIEDFRQFLAPSKQKARFNAFSALNSVLKLITEKFARDGIAIETRADQAVTIFGFESELRQVLINVLNNARDVLIERQIAEKRIVISVSQRQEGARIAILDNGGGIPDHVMPHIFDSYYTTKPEGQGTGIGLYMSQAIIEKSMGGRFYAENRDQGALFVIEL